MYIYLVDNLQLHEYSCYNETQPTPLANDVAALDVLKQVINAQSPRYNPVCQTFVYYFYSYYMFLHSLPI